MREILVIIKNSLIVPSYEKNMKDCWPFLEQVLKEKKVKVYDKLVKIGYNKK